MIIKIALGRLPIKHCTRLYRLLDSALVEAVKNVPGGILLAT